MTTRRERTLAGLAMGAIILAWFAVVISFYYIPRLVDLWAQAGQPLSSAQRLLVSLGSLIDHGFGVIAPSLLFATVAAFVWRIRIGRKALASVPA